MLGGSWEVVSKVVSTVLGLSYSAGTLFLTLDAKSQDPLKCVVERYEDHQSSTL